MKSSILFKNKILNLVNKSIMNLPSPSNINYMWNLGSLLGFMLMIQISTGILISMHYTPNIFLAFNSIIHIMKDTSNGWMTRLIHLNGASFFFFFIYLHILKGLNQSSFKFNNTWNSGTSMLIMLMATAFLGYVLPWGQMSFWGATVITNLFSAIPFIGFILVEWLWGGFSVGNPTLNRFYSLHFLMPFILSFFIILHLIFLHEKGSSNPSNSNSNLDKIEFSSFFYSKDLMTIIISMIMMIFINNLIPNVLGDPENYNQANPLSTPIHIQPEWYFLFAYAILRSIPNKLGGVISLFLSILILYMLPLKFTQILSNKFSPMKKFFLIMISFSFLTLTWIGANPVEMPYELVGKFLTILYFFSFIYSLKILVLKTSKDMILLS